MTEQPDYYDNHPAPTGEELGQGMQLIADTYGKSIEYSCIDGTVTLKGVFIPTDKINQSSHPRAGLVVFTETLNEETKCIGSHSVRYNGERLFDEFPARWKDRHGIDDRLYQIKKGIELHPNGVFVIDNGVGKYYPEELPQNFRAKLGNAILGLWESKNGAKPSELT